MSIIIAAVKERNIPVTMNEIQETIFFLIKKITAGNPKTSSNKYIIIVMINRIYTSDKERNSSFIGSIANKTRYKKDAGNGASKNILVKYINLIIFITDYLEKGLEGIGLMPGRGLGAEGIGHKSLG